MLADSTRCIAIVGAGFCGTITAVNLLRESHVEPLRILLIDREPHARGTAYAAHPHPYLLNVPAGRMSALSSDPLEATAVHELREHAENLAQQLTLPVVARAAAHGVRMAL